MLTTAGMTVADLGGLVVGTGPGAFTGLRVGLATAKALARGLDIPIAGVATCEALLSGVAASRPGCRPCSCCRPVRPIEWSSSAARPSLVKGGEEPELPAGTPFSSPWTCPARAPADAIARGAHGRGRHLAAAMLRLGAARIAAGGDDVARLVPEYVTLPRGVRGGQGRGAMVARPPVAIVSRPDDGRRPAPPSTSSSTRASRTPWPSHAYRQELETNRLAHYIVARFGDAIVGFAGMWLLVDEAHITTFATRTDVAPAGGGGAAAARAARTLRGSRRHRGHAGGPSHPTSPPGSLYEKYGFKVVGVRPRYYSDNNEDALIMTTDSLDGRSMLDRIARLRADLARTPRDQARRGRAADGLAPRCRGSRGCVAGRSG